MTFTLPNATNPTLAQCKAMGAHFAYAADFGKGDLVEGQDFDQSILVGDNCPDGTIIRGNWPFTPNRKEIRGFNSIRHGEQSRGVPAVPLKPVRAGGLGRLEFDFRFHVAHIGRMNLLDDTFLYVDPADTRASSRNAELCVYHWPADSTMEWAQRVEERQLGIWTDRDGRKWWATFLDRADGKRIVRFLPVDGPALEGTLYRGGMIRFGIDQGAFDPALFYTGAAIGVEPIVGPYELSIDRWAAVVA